MRSKILISLVIICILLTSCNLPSNYDNPSIQPPVPGVDVVGTSVELTTVARMAQLDPGSGAAVVPTNTSQGVPVVVATPTFTPIILPSNTPITVPCNKASFVDDVNYPDGTKVDAEANFTKTWRLKNVGSCTWTSGYSVIFDNGDRMGAPDWFQLTGGTVPPGGTADISVNLKAPASAGTYQGFYKLKASDGAVFGINADGQSAFWVKVAVKTADSGESASGKPDLVAYAFQYAPKPAKRGQSASVMVSVTNEGDAKAGAFTVIWYSNQTTVGCTWPVSGLGVGKRKDLECQYIYWSSFTNYASFVVDSSDQVAESNESNNEREWEWVVKP